MRRSKFVEGLHGTLSTLSTHGHGTSGYNWGTATSVHRKMALKIYNRHSIPILLLALALAACTTSPSAPATSAQPTPLPPTPATPPASAPTAESQAFPLGDPLRLLTVRGVRSSGSYEPGIHAGDFNGDGLEDLVVTRLRFQTYETFPIDILLNDGSGGLVRSTDIMFIGDPPAVQNPSQVLIADFNGDGTDDIFIADHGYDAPPHPGFPNSLVLSAPGGKLVNASRNLPKRPDFTHSAAAADVDGDGDLDIYVGNIWGEQGTDPYLLLNDGVGDFARSRRPPPPELSLNHNGYTTAAFADVDGDGSPDLILGDAGDDIDNEYSSPLSIVLLNNGRGRFRLLPRALPQKTNSHSDIGHVIQPLSLNGDSYVDLLMVYERPDSGGSYFQALINNGDGTFHHSPQTEEDLLIRNVMIHRLDLRDLDDDGDLDLIARPWDDQNPAPYLFINNRGGRFNRFPYAQGLPHLYYDFLDFDGDGGHDLVFATYAPPEEIYLMRDLRP